MGRARFYFHGELNDLLPRCNRARWLDYEFRDAPSLKHAIETFGVPHPEVGEPADLGRRLEDNEAVEVHPRRYAAPPGGAWRFVLDCHLGRLAKYLRILGFDTLYERAADDLVLAAAAAGDRVLLTMDRSLLMRKPVAHGALVRHADPREQLWWMARRFHLWGHIEPLRRCLRCNALLAPVAKESVLEKIPPKTRLWCERYVQCTGCGHLYWPGSHYDRMQAWIGAMRAEGGGPGDSGKRGGGAGCIR